jgi:hypothetical protein
VAAVAMAEVADQQGWPEDALGHLTDGIGRCRQLAYTQPLATGLATQAFIRQASGDPARAREAMAEAGRVAPGSGVTTLLNPVPARRARLLLAQGDVAAAARWARERGLAADDQASYAREPELLVLARVLLAQDRPGPALALLERLLAAAAGQGRLGSVIELRAPEAGPGGPRRRAVSGGGPGRRPRPGLPPGLRPGLRRRGRPHGRAPRPAGRGPVDRGDRRPRRPPGLPGPAPEGLRRPARRAGGAQAGRTADHPRAGGAGAAGRRPAQPGHRRGAGGHRRHRQEARQPRPGQAGAANRTEAVARARELGLLP